MEIDHLFIFSFYQIEIFLYNFWVNILRSFLVDKSLGDWNFELITIGDWFRVSLHSFQIKVGLGVFPGQARLSFYTRLAIDVNWQ